MINNLPPKKTNKLIKIGDAAKKLGVSIDTLRRWERTGKIPSHRTPAGTRLYSIKELNQAFVANKKSLPTQITETPNTNLIENKAQSFYRKTPISLPNLAQEILTTKTFISETPTVFKNNLNIFTNNFHTLKTVFFTQIITVLSVLIFFTLVFSLSMTAGYLIKPGWTESFSNKNQLIVAPFQKIALSLLKISMPDKLNEIQKQFPPPNLLARNLETNKSRSSEISLGLGGQVLAATTSGQYLQINAPTEINGPLFSTTLNTGFGDNELYPMNQPVLTTSTVTFGGLNLPVLTLTGPSNQLTLANTIISTQPGGSGAFTVSIPSLSGNGNFVIDTATQTLTNKTISGSSNTFSNIPNSALSNNSITVSAGSGLSGGGTVALGGSITLSAASQSGVTSITGTANQVIASASTGAVTLSLPQDIATTSTPTFSGLDLNGSTSGTLTLNAAATTTDYTLTLPNTAGTAGYVLTTDGSGNTSWTSGSGITVTWDSIDDPAANQTLNMSTYTTTWNSTTTSGTFFNINANSLTNGAGANISSTSTAGTGSGASYLLNLSRSGTNSNNSHTAYGLSSTVTNTGTTNTNIAGYFSASGASSSNYGLYVAAGDVNIQGLTASSGVYTDSNKNLTSTAPSSGTLGFWTRTGTTLSPSNSGDVISTTGNIGAGTLTPATPLEVKGTGTGSTKSIVATNSSGTERFSIQDDGQLNVSATGGTGRWIPGTGIYTYSLRSQNGSSLINLDGGAMNIFDGNGITALNLTDRSSSKLNGKLFIGDSTTTPTALLHLAAGTATANTAPLKLTSGTNLTTAEAGAVEYDGTQLYFSPANTDRNILLQNSSSTAFTSGSIPFATTNGYLTEDNSNLFWDDSNNRLGINDNTPSFSLDVTGTAQITGAATFGSTTTLNGITYTWPGSQSNGYVLSTNGSGTLSWTDPASLTIRWNTIDDPNGNQTLTMGTNTSSWNWATGTSTNNLFNLTTDNSSDGTGSLLNIQTGTSSTVLPLRIRAGSSEALIVNASGNVGIGDITPSSKLEVGDGTDSLQVSSVGDLTFVDANSSASITGPAGGSLNIIGGSGQSITNTSSVTTGTGTSSAFVFNASALTSGTALYLTSTATSGKTLDINATQTSGTIFNLAYGSATTLGNDLTGLLVDLNSGNVDATNQNLTGVNFKIPTVTNTITSGTKTLTGMLVNFGSGAGINQNGAGGTLEFIAGDFHLPALTQTAGTLNAYGTKITTPASITTGGTAYGNYVSATGVGAGTLNGLGISSITGGAGTEYALAIGTGWDAVLRVGSTTVINGSGITQVAGGGTGQSSYTTGDILYASNSTTLTKLPIGNPNEVLTVSAGIPAWATISGSSCTNCLVNNPTATQTISPTNDSTGLSIRQTSAVSPTADIFNITDSTGATKYFYVDKDGNVSTGAISNTTLTLTPTTNTTALTLVGTNVTSAKNQYINTKNSSGTISDISYGASQTLSGSIIGHNIDLSTNVTATNQSATGYVVTLPAATNTSGTQTYKGFVVTGGSINENGGTATTFTGVDVTIPTLTQTSGTLTAYGTNITTPSSITTGGTAAGFNVTASGVGSGTLYGLNISDISAGAGTEVGAQIGSGWDTNLLFNDTTTRIAVANGGTITILDTAGNSLCTITDSGSTGNLNCSGNITAGGGTVGYWNRDAGTSTLSPTTSGDNVTTSGNISTTGSGTITSAGLLTGSAGATISGATTSINASSNFATLINTGTSNGSVTIGNSAAGAINLASGAASSFAVTNANLTINTTGASGANGRIVINSALASGNTTTEAISLKTTTDLGATDEVLQFGDSGGDFVTLLGNGNFGIGDLSPAALLTVGTSDAFQVNSSGAIAAATGITSSGTINFSTLSASSAVYTDSSKNLTSTAPTSGTIGYWSRTSTTLSPATAGDNVTTSGNISTSSSGTITAAATLTASNGFTMTTGALSLTSTSGSISSTGLTGLTQTLSSGTAAITAPTLNLNTSSTGNTAIGNSTGTFALTSNGGLNVTTGGALTGVTSLDTIATSATALTFAGAGTISSTTSSSLTLDSGTTGAVNLGTGSNAKTVTIGNATGATALAFNSGTGAQTHTSQVATTTTTSSAFVFDATAITSGTGMYLTTDSITSGKILDIATTGNTWTGNGTTTGLINIASTSTAGTGSNSSIVLNIARSGANANSSHGTYGIYSTVTNTGTNSANYAGLFSASGATNNYAIVVPSGGGNVGIATTTPSTLFQVGTNSTTATYGSKSAEFTNSVVASDSGYQLRNTAGNGTIFGLAIDGSDNLYAGHNNPALILRANSSTISTVNSSGITISTGGLSIGGVSASSGTLATASHPSLSSPGDVCRDGSTGVYGQCASDMRLKENISLINESGLDLINQLKPSHFDFKTGAKNQVGFIAQEVLEVLPQAVSLSTDGYYGLDDRDFTPYLVKAIQELDNKVEDKLLTINENGLPTEIVTEKITLSGDIQVGGLASASNFAINASIINQTGTLSNLDIINNDKVSLAQVINLLNDSQSNTDTNILGLQTENDLQENRLNDTNTQVLSQAQQLASAAAELADAKNSIAVLNNDIADLKLTPPSVLESTESATFANIDVTEHASILNLSTIDATISGTFKALGTAILPSTTIAGDLTVDGTLSITEGNTLDVIGTLFLQKNALAENLDIFNGKVTIDKTGKIAIEELALGSQSVGEATIEEGQTEITIPTSIVKSNSKIFITPTSELSGNIIVGQITEGQNFKVRLSSTNANDVKFNWLIVGTKLQ